MLTFVIKSTSMVPIYYFDFQNPLCSKPELFSFSSISSFHNQWSHLMGCSWGPKQASLPCNKTATRPTEVWVGFAHPLRSCYAKPVSRGHLGNYSTSHFPLQGLPKFLKLFWSWDQLMLIIAIRILILCLTVLLIGRLCLNKI